MGLQTNIPAGDHKVRFLMELEQEAYFGGEIESFSRKNERKNIKLRSPRENHLVALSDPKKRKIKDKSEGENLSKAPEDGRFNLPISKY